MKFASCLLLAFCALDSMISGGVHAAQTALVVKYTFDDDTSDPPFLKNTGDGDTTSWFTRTLDGRLYSEGGRNRAGITFGTDASGDGTTAAHFEGTGCIQIPESDAINLRPVKNRTISLDFKWEGTTSINEPQVLFEEGGQENGINILLSPITQSTAELVMAVWEGTNAGDVPPVFDGTLVCTKTIDSNTWYNAAIVLHQARQYYSFGSVAGYLDGSEYASQEIDFFGVKEHSGESCVGGMTTKTRIFPTNGSDSYGSSDMDGLYFNGWIDNFELYNSVEIPGPPPTARPPLAPPLVEEQVFGNCGRNFTGIDCFPIFHKSEINGHQSDRTISLDFLWNGTYENDDPQILYEQGGKRNGINMYLGSFSQGKAELAMAVWEDANDRLSVLSAVLDATITIESHTWYTATLVLDRFDQSDNGILSGYLDEVQFGEAAINFFPLRPQQTKNCLGGMRQETLIVDNDGGQTAYENYYGLNFHGRIKNFRIYNSVQIPPPPTLSPAPSQSPTGPPTQSPIAAPTQSPTAPPTPSPTSLTTMSPSFMPTLAPSLMPVSAPVPSPSLAPEWKHITYDGFENGWGNFTKVSRSRRITWANANQRSYIPKGAAAVRIRADSGVSHEADQNVTGYSNLRVYFQFTSRYMDSGDSFVLEYSSDSGATYTVVKEYVYGEDFENDVSFYHDTVDFEAIGATYELTAFARIGFRCVAGNGDFIYIDEVKFEGEVPAN